MKSVAFFNNKGGVGKTTLACNVAATLSMSFDKKVLIVDCDPQCNSTQLVMSSANWSPLYLDGGGGQETILDALKPIEQGDASIAEGVVPLTSESNRFAVDLLPGHPRMSVVEDILSGAWGSASSGDIGGIRKTNWMQSLLGVYADQYDVIIVDAGPSLGSLNRTILIGADHFVTPMGADIFSIVGIRNIAEWISSWEQVYTTGLSLSDTRHPGSLEQFEISSNKIVATFIGYTVQQYITKSKQGIRRPTQAFEAILNKIPDEIESGLKRFTDSHLREASLKLGDVPNMYSLIPLAQSVNAPISSLLAADGLAGGQFNQQKNYRETIANVTQALLSNLGI